MKLHTKKKTKKTKNNGASASSFHPPIMFCGECCTCAPPPPPILNASFTTMISDEESQIHDNNNNNNPPTKLEHMHLRIYNARTTFSNIRMNESSGRQNEKNDNEDDGDDATTMERVDILKTILTELDGVKDVTISKSHLPSRMEYDEDTTTENNVELVDPTSCMVKVEYYDSSSSSSSSLFSNTNNEQQSSTSYNLMREREREFELAGNFERTFGIQAALLLASLAFVVSVGLMGGITDGSDRNFGGADDDDDVDEMANAYGRFVRTDDAAEAAMMIRGQSSSTAQVQGSEWL
mmetsp:Transcript_10327/g.21845  ORF Transcript_10327/g.21845 Transcript_10327/m.21845 type:complete len:294 (+) Transcript_10327:275-1156(+)